MNKSKNNYLREKSGITLIALVVTIIVLIILAGISINLVLGENGIITKAKEASKAQEIAEIKEGIQLQIITIQANNGGDLKESDFESLLRTKGTLSNEENILERTLTTTEGGHPIKVTEIYNGKLKTYTAYTRGQEVTIGTETFYVLEDSDETKETVTLFAKYNLNKAGTAQVNVLYGDTACVFSTSNYWKDEKLDVTPKFNLNKYGEVIADSGSAVYKTKKYAISLLGETTKGRLLTYEEATALKSAITIDTTGKIAEMLWGKANTQIHGSFLYYWLGSANSSDRVWYVDGSSRSMNNSKFDNRLGSGVRPVIEVSKSLI